MHFLHMIDPQRRQWWRRLRMLNLFPQSGQKGTSWSLTQGTTDFSIAVGRRQKPNTHEGRPFKKKRDRVRMKNKEQKEREQSSRVSYLGSSQTRYLFCQTQSADKEKKGSEGMNLEVDTLSTGGSIKWE